MYIAVSKADWLINTSSNSTTELIGIIYKFWFKVITLTEKNF